MVPMDSPNGINIPISELSHVAAIFSKIIDSPTSAGGTVVIRWAGLGLVWPEKIGQRDCYWLSGGVRSEASMRRYPTRVPI